MAKANIEKAHQVGDMHPNGKWTWTEYKPGNEPATSTTVIDASEGGNLGIVQLHRNPLAKWLANADFTTYASQYGAVGAECLETPRYIKVTVGGAVLTADYAAKIGADHYSKDAMGLVRDAEAMFPAKMV